MSWLSFRRWIHIRAVEDAHDFCDVVLCLRIGRHALVLFYSSWSRIVCGECHLNVSTEIVELLFQVSGAALDILHHIVSIYAKRRRCVRHKLHDALSPSARDRGLVKVTLRLCNGKE